MGIATLNRPHALNALNTNMVETLYSIYTSWNVASDVSCILLKGNGGKAFCAGGDVKSVVKLGKQGKIEEAMRFFSSEYRVDYLISQLNKPHVAFLDGITMGGGVGVSIHGMFRIATEKTVFAMPELAIGLFPDVGGSYFLPRLPKGMGAYLAYTGSRLQGLDVKRAGIATHYIPSRYLGEIEATLVSSIGISSNVNKISELLAAFERKEPLPSPQLTSARMAAIASIFGENTLREIILICQKSKEEWLLEAVKAMLNGSPTSMMLTAEQLRKGATMELDECFQMENRLVYHLVTNVDSDFYRGVDALLISKSEKPHWNPALLGQVDKATVARCFEPVPPGFELRLSGPQKCNL